MNGRFSTLALLGASALSTLCAGQALAQDQVDPPALVSEEAAPDEATANNEFLQAQVESLQSQIDALKKQMTAAQPSWKGAPQWSDGNSGGFTFKPKGFAQFDAGYNSIPRDLTGTVGGLNTNNLGWNTRARRLVIGAEGSLPGGFGYKVEFNLAQSTVDYEDIVLTYQRAGSPLLVTIGNAYPLSSLETMTSSRLGSFMERAALTEAFGYNRRLGVSVGYIDPNDGYSLTAGVYSQPINDQGFARTGWQASVRGVYSPMLGSTRLHMGVNYQHRVNQKDAQNVRYQMRPYNQLTDQRFVDTGTIASKGDDVIGVELAAIHGPVHFAGEAAKLWVDGYRPGSSFGGNNGVGGAAFYADDPSFLSAYGEIGFFLTGETRGYKGGKWDRTKVLKPFDQGGWGALQVNARIDYLDLEDRLAGTNFAAPNFVNGGKQTGYELSLIWNPMDYIRFMAQYARVHVNGGPRAGAIVPGVAPVTDKSFNSDTFGVRAQVEF